VHIEIPLDVLGAAAEGSTEARAGATRPTPDPGAVADAAALLLKAKRPMIVAGGGTVDGAAEVRALAEATGAAVVLTTAGKGVVPDDHPLCLGATLLMPASQKLLAGADVVVAIGTELSETDSWIDRLEIPGKLIRIDLDRRTIARDYAPTVAILADAAAALSAILRALGGKRPAGAIAAAEIEKARTANRSGWPALQQKHAKVLDAVRAALPEDGIVVTDMTQIAYTGNYHFPLSNPRCWFHPVGFGTLGYAVPAAIGAKLGRPESAVVAVAGDAGFMFTVQDLATAVEQKLPIAILLWNNDALGQIAGDMVNRGIPEIGVKPRNPDFMALARAFGCGAVRPANLAELETALTHAFEADAPTLIEVREDARYLA
jgi:thiamine pyrophosphate-dependent acetolactate synthase large subunit-like protein